MKDIKITKILLPCLVVVVLIPILLNIILQCKTGIPIPIINGREEGTVIWLQFWGSYLSAIASFIMAYIAYRQGIDNQLDNQKIRAQEAKKTEYVSLKNDFEIFEKYVLDNAKLYTVNRFTHIGILCENKQYLDANYAQKVLLSDLDCSSLNAARFSSYISNSDMNLKQYISLLQIYNETYVKYAVEVKECLCRNTSDRIVSELTDICKRLENDNRLYPSLSNVGFDALMKMKNKMDEILNSCNDLSN